MTEPAGPDLRRGREHVHAGAAAEIEHPLAREQAREAEVVAHARERVHGFGGQPVEQIGGVAERLGERAAGGEVEVAARLVRHIAVHLRDVAVELFGIHASGGGVCGVRVHAGSVAGARLPETLAAGGPRVALGDDRAPSVGARVASGRARCIVLRPPVSSAVGSSARGRL